MRSRSLDRTFHMKCSKCAVSRDILNFYYRKYEKFKNVEFKNVLINKALKKILKARRTVFIMCIYHQLLFFFFNYTKCIFT